jgi:D-alanyl-D-alanine carboxypeptidase
MNEEALEYSLEFIKSWLAFRYDRCEIPGYVVAVAYKGKVLMNEAYGYADLEKKTKLTPQHIFRIASHSKTFTSTALMQLVEKDKLRLEDYVVNYLPWLKEHKDKRWNKVTVRQLLSHSAGIIRDGLNADYWQLDSPFPNEEELKAEVLKAELVIDNNTKLKYSNYGYSLLGMVVEKVSGKPYNEYVSEHIVKPLELTNTGPEYSPSIESKIVTGYTRRDVNKSRLPIAQIDTRAMSPATGFYSNTEDVCKYFTAHFVGSGKLLDDESKKEMQRVQWHVKPRGKDSHEDYGLGIEVVFVDKHRTVGHGGGFPGHSTKTMADPNDKLVVVALTNCIDGSASRITKGVYGVIDHYQKNTRKDKPKHNLNKLEGRFMNLWAISDIIVTGDKIVSVYPDSWEPMSDQEELEYVDDNILKVIDASNFDSEGELVHFRFKDGGVESVDYNGSTMWPEAVWLKRQSERNIVE